MLEFPQLTGQYAVGAITRHVIDTSRQEPQNPSTNRELMVHMWYPASSPDKNPLILYRQDEIEATKIFLKQFGYPEKDIKELDTIFSHALPNAPVLHKNNLYPIIIFSHGYLGCSPVDFTALCEELASHGYVIASIAHTYYAQMVKFPDGRQISPSAEMFSQHPVPTHKVQDLWTADVMSVLNYLMKVNTDKLDLFYKFFDINRVGIVGHSMGGSTAYRLCLNNSQFKAGVSFDASPWAQDKSVDELQKPFLFIFSEKTLQDLNKTDAELAELYKTPVELIREFKSLSQQEVRADLVIPAVTHSGFSDYLLIKEIPLYKNNRHLIDFEAIFGTADGRKTITLINSKIVQFFEKSL